MRWRTEYNEQVLKELARLNKVDEIFRSCGICTTMRVVESADIFISD